MVALNSSKWSSHNAQQSHTRSISQPNPRICNLVSTTHKECWGELAGQENVLRSSEIAKESAALAREGQGV